MRVLLSGPRSHAGAGRSENVELAIKTRLGGQVAVCTAARQSLVHWQSVTCSQHSLTAVCARFEYFVDMKNPTDSYEIFVPVFQSHCIHIEQRFYPSNKDLKENITFTNKQR